MKVPEGHDKHMLWFAHADGWFCSDTLFEAPFDFDEVRTDIKISLHADLQGGVNMPRIVHMLMHVPDLIFRWNAVRNMWCFFNERYKHYRNNILTWY